MFIAGLDIYVYVVLLAEQRHDEMLLATRRCAKVKASSKSYTQCRSAGRHLLLRRGSGAIVLCDLRVYAGL